MLANCSIQVPTIDPTSPLSWWTGQSPKNKMRRLINWSYMQINLLYASLIGQPCRRLTKNLKIFRKLRSTKFIIKAI